MITASGKEVLVVLYMVFNGESDFDHVFSRTDQLNPI